MKTSLKRTKDSWAAWLARLAVLAVLPMLAVVYDAHSSEQSRDAGVVLTYDAATEALLKVVQGVLHQSRDGGESWESIPLPPSSQGTITAVATPAGSGETIYISGPEIGVMRTQDGGQSWTSLNEGLPNTDVISLAAHSTLPETLYLYIPGKGIYRTQDEGASWQLMDSGPEGIRQLIHTNMEGSMETGWLYAATAQGAKVSMDCFCLWRGAGDLSSPVYSLAFDPRQPKELYASTEQGLFRSEDGGQEWKEATSPNASPVALTMSPSGALFAATTAGALFKSTDRGGSWEPVNG